MAYACIDLDEPIPPGFRATCVKCGQEVSFQPKDAPPTT
jgi:hypothetical protein